jgi:PHD/YefM family antitoxin component YafN of YafNO toxin-antitoxin module
MIAHTLTLQEAETRLRDLVKQAQTTRQPVILVTEETAEPVAVLVESSLFETMQRREQQLFHLQLRQLLRHLNDLEQRWQHDVARQEFVPVFRAAAHALWDVCPGDRRGVGLTLDMAARRLAPERLTRAQIAALRFCLDLLRDLAPAQESIAECRQRLIECGLPPTMAGDESLVRLYVDES